MLRFSLLGSGSSGNALLIVSPSSKVLIDNGLSLRQLQGRVAHVRESLEGLAAVFVTHEHADHVNGVGILARRLGVPVYMTAATRNNLPSGVGVIPRIELFEPGEDIHLDGMRLRSFSVSHDAVDPVGFEVSFEGAKLGVASDLGHASHLVRNRLAGSHGLILEANYCPDMLRRGPYPVAVQQRIRSTQGHLSNKAMTALLGSLLHDGLRVVVLAHVSEENNTRELVHKLASSVVARRPVDIVVARPDRPTPLFEIRP